MPRNTEELKNKSNKVAKRNLKEGDVVFFSSNRSRKRVAHVGIYRCVYETGLTYYIRHNALPEKRVEFYIAQKVGSILAEPQQRGLAHFLEHMACLLYTSRCV